jgi:hypothetical protein
MKPLDPATPFLTGTFRAISRALIGLALGAFVFPFTALAALGENEQSVMAEQKSMKASLRTTRTGSYTRHELEAPNGMVVREYLSPGGTVFAVAWEGPLMPDFRKLFGERYGQFEQAVRERVSARPRMRGPLTVRRPGLVVQLRGRMRAYLGYAYVPGLVPQGMSVEDLP